MNGHPIREEDFDLLALGALDADERRELEAHVASCAACAAKLAEARGRIALLAAAAPPAAPSAAVKQRLMQQVRAEARPARAAREKETSPSLFGKWWFAVLAPAGAVLAIATILLWNENRKLDRELADLHASVQQQEQQLHEAREVADLITSSDTVTVALSPQPGMPKGTAHVMYNMKMGMLMYEGVMTPPAAEKSYQLWIMPAQGKPISAGVFNPVSGQSDHWMMKMPQGIEPKAFTITLEPSGGMPQPTGPMVMMGSPS